MNTVFETTATQNPEISQFVVQLWHDIKSQNFDPKYWDASRIIDEATSLKQKSEAQAALDAMLCICVPAYTQMRGVTAHGAALVAAARENVRVETEKRGEPSHISHCQSGAINYFWE